MANCIKSIPSISFSGAGFLGCYHVGAAACLLKHGYLPRPGEVATSNSKLPPILLGASAGAITCAGVVAGVSTEEAMDFTYKMARKTREKGGRLDVFCPGFSLIDEVDCHLYAVLDKALNGDLELLQRRIRNDKDGTSLLRIALSNRHDLARIDITKAYRYTDTYRDIEDICAAAILSSFIPGITGPLRGGNCDKNLAIGKAWKRMQEMIELGFVKDGLSETVIDLTDVLDKSSSRNELESTRARESYWDGGVSNMWPVLNNETLIISPLNGYFEPNPFVVPAVEDKSNDTDKDPIPSFPHSLRLDNRTRIGINKFNFISGWRICVSSEDSFIDERFQNGYDDTSRYLRDNNLEQVFSSK